MSNKQKVKSKSLLSLLLVLTMVFGMLPIIGTATASAYTGNGTKSKPYLVTSYEELKSLLEDNTSKYIRLGKNIKYTAMAYQSRIDVGSGNYVLDLAGYILDYSYSSYNAGLDQELFYIDEGSLTINDSRGNALVKMLAPDDEWKRMFTVANGTLTVNGGDYEINSMSTYYVPDVICVQAGTLTINGGSFTTTGRGVYGQSGAHCTINGGKFLIKNNGAFEHDSEMCGIFLTSGNYAEAVINTCIVESEKKIDLIKLNGGFSLGTCLPDNALVSGECSPVGLISDSSVSGSKAVSGTRCFITNGTEESPYFAFDYAMLQNLMATAPASSTTRYIKLMENITHDLADLDDTLSITTAGQWVNLDLNGYDISCTYKAAKSDIYNIFDVKNGRLDISDDEGGSLVSAEKLGIPLYVKEGGSLYAYSGTYYSEKSNAISIDSASKVYINGGTFKSKELNGLCSFDSSGARSKIIINDGSFVTESGGCGGAVFWDGDVTVNGGSFHNNLTRRTSDGRDGIAVIYNPFYGWYPDVTIHGCETLGGISGLQDAWKIGSDSVVTGINKDGTTYSVTDADAFENAYRLEIGRYITRIDIDGIDAPVAGKLTDTTATVKAYCGDTLLASDRFDNMGVIWYDWDSNKTLSVNDVFEQGHAYMVMVTLNTSGKQGYVFSTEDSKPYISVNGNKGFLWISNKKEAQCCYDFGTLTEPQPVITTQPSGGHSSVMGDSIVLNIEAENATEYTWHIIDEDGKELTWNYLSNNGYANPQVASGGKMFFLRNVSDWMTGKRVYCEVKGNGGTVMSDIVTLSVDKVIKYCNDLYFEDFDQIWNHKTVGDFKNPKNDADAPYTIGNVRWEMFSKILNDDFEFANGDNVAVRIDVIPKEGYTFYSTVFGKLNGIDSYATIKNEDGSRSIVFNMTITIPDEYKTQDIELSVAEPVAGETPATTAVCTSGYVIPETLAWTPADETFKTNTEYTVKIPVKAEYAWGDTSTVTAKVNGKDATFIAEYKGGKQYAYYVEYTFDATGSEIEQDYDITVEGGKAYNGSGEEITKCNEGATVTLKANDAPEGMDFDRWEVVIGDVTLADETDPDTTFVMPANAVSIKATYNLIPHIHIFDLETIKEKALKTPADCENDAVYYKSCSICEEISDTETFTATDTAKGHSFKNYVSDKNATCISDGTKTAKCERCEVTDMVTDKGSAKGHNYSTVWSKDETHHWHECSVCRDKKDNEEHTPNIAEPTETQAKVCTVCDYVIADKLPAKNGTVIVDGKTVLYIGGTAVTGTKVVTVYGKTYAVVKGYVVTGKTQIVNIGSKTYIVDKNGIVIKATKNKLIKVSSKKWYIINKYGIVIKAKKGNKLVNVGKKTYIVNKKGLVQKSAKNKLVKVGKKSYIVDKKGVVLKNKKAVKVGKKTYKVNKKGIATRKK